MLSFCFGVVYLLLIPPFQSPDEPNHFFRAYQVSEGHFFPERTADHRLGGGLPESLGAFAGAFAGLKGSDTLRASPDALWREWGRPLAGRQRVFTDFANTAIYAPTAYLPQATGIAVGRWLGLSPLGLLYAARLANFWCWWFLIGMALKATPYQWRLMAVLACLPASLVLAASVNADVVTNGLCFWLIAQSFKKTQAAFGWILLAGMLVCAHKMIAWPLLLLYVMGVRPADGRWRAYWKPAFLCLLGLAAAFCWGLLAHRWFIPYDAYHPDFRETQTLNEGVNPEGQVAFVKSHPLFFLKTMTVSAIKTVPSSAAHVVGKFGWEKNYLPAFWLALLWGLLLAVAGADSSPGFRQRWCWLGIVVCYVVLFAGTMYALWHPVGAAAIGNWQGRYFVPILPILLMAVGGYGWKLQGDRLGKGAWSALFMANLVMVWCILERYW